MVKQHQIVQVVKTVEDLRAQLQQWYRTSLTVGFVPTMGSLHDGHCALIKQAKVLCDRVCVSIFVNPAQFAPEEDFKSYPRDEAADLTILEKLGCHLSYMPSVDQMYPPDFATRIHVDKLSEGLCSWTRPHFFDGVTVVMTKLLIQIMPTILFLGEKDYQQLQVIKRLIHDLDLPVLVVSVPIVRALDGLALSSRNVYLTDSQRTIAPKLYALLVDAAKNVVTSSQPIEHIMQQTQKHLLDCGFDHVDYVCCRDAENLTPITQFDSKNTLRLLAAVRLGSTRLIDNVPVYPNFP